MNRDFNAIAKVLLGLGMFATIITIINSFLMIGNYRNFGLDIPKTLVPEIIIDFLILVAASFTLLRKKVGLIILILLIVVRIFATLQSGGDLSTAGQLGARFAITFRDFGLFAIAMCFKKNGVTGWASMLASEEHLSASLQSAEMSIDKNDEPSTTTNNGVNDEEIGASSEDMKADATSIIEGIGNHTKMPEVNVFDAHDNESGAGIDMPSTPNDDRDESNKRPSVVEFDDIPLSQMESVDIHQEAASVKDYETPQAMPSEGNHILTSDFRDESLDKKRIAELEDENARLKQMYAELALQLNRKKQ